MKNIEERLNPENLRNERIFNNEVQVIDKILEQCTDDCKVEEISFAQDKELIVKHFQLPTGQHVYISNYGEKNVFILNDVCEQNKLEAMFHTNARAILNDYMDIAPHNGVMIRANIRPGAYSEIAYLAADNGNSVLQATSIYHETDDKYLTHVQVLDNYLRKVPESGDTLIDIIREEYDRESKEIDAKLKPKSEVLLNDFYGLLQPAGREDLEVATEEEIAIRELKRKIAELEKTNEQLRKDGEEKDEQISQLSMENVSKDGQISQLTRENMSLKERFMHVRQFMTQKCAKIPFFGKSLLKAMKEELGEKELPESSYHDEK